MRSAVPRWAILVAVPLLVGAVLLMHGIDAAAHAAPPPGVAGEEHHDQHGRDHPCQGCPSAQHLVIACVAIGVTFVTTVRARLRPGPTFASAVVALVSTVRHGVGLVARPPDPAWVRLSVMRC